MSVVILLRNGKKLHDLIISLKGKVKLHETRLTTPHFVKMRVPSPESE